MIKKIWYAACTSCLLISQAQPTIVIGDPDATTNNTFSFNVGFAKYNPGETRASFDRLWLASGELIATDAAKQYALSYVAQLPAEPFVMPTTQELIAPRAQPMANSENAYIFSFNSTTKLVQTTCTPNPIYGAQFSLFDTYDTKPLFVITSALNQLYYAHDIQHFPIQTETHFNKTELLLYDLGTLQEAKALLGGSDGIYLAYADGVFGTATSNIAKFVTTSQKQGESKKPQPYLHMVAQTPVTLSTAALIAGGSALAILGSNVTLCGFPSTGAIYVGLQTTASAGPGDKAAGAMMVNTVDTSGVISLAFAPIADNSVMSNSVNTVISAPSNSSIRITNMASMRTSTSLNYLIIARDNGTGPQSIFAVPLVSTAGSDLGKIADATIIETTFNTSPPSYASRDFTTLLTDVTQIDIDTPTAQIKVGAGAIPLASGNITNMYTAGDAVYVVIGSPIAVGTQPGTFYSQAIFAQDGHIVNWTPWARVMGSDKPMLYSHMGNQSTVNFYVANADAGSGCKQVVHTQWNIDNNLSIMFAPPYMAKGGTQGIFSFGQSTTGFGDALSLLITTGYNQVTIGQTGYAPALSEFAIKPMTSSEVVPFSNINSSTSLVAAELANNGANHWLFAGGASGLAVLTGDSTGYTKTGNFTTVSDFSAGQTWKSVGDFSYVKKLVWDQTFLYVLTRTALYQIALDPNKFTATPTADLNPVTILTSKDVSKNPYLLDVIIDSGFCILGTTNGMFSFDASSGKPTNINKIAIPDGLPAAAQLIAVSNSNTPQRSFKTQSNLTVLNSTFETQQARLNRFVINDGIITPFNDALFNSPEQPDGVPTSFIRFNQYYSNYYTNGTWNLASNYFLGITQPPSVPSAGILQLSSEIKNGVSSSKTLLPSFSAQVSTKFLTGTNLFLGVIRESTSGAFIASGSLVARINA